MSEKLSSLLQADVREFLSFIGVGKLKGNAEDEKVLENVRSLYRFVREIHELINRLIQSLYLFWKRSRMPTSPKTLESGGYINHNDPLFQRKHPLDNMDKLILENVFRLITMLHNIYLPSVQTGKPWKYPSNFSALVGDWSIIYSPDRQLRIVINTNIVYPNQDSADFKSRMVRLPWMVSHLRKSKLNSGRYTLSRILS